MKIWEGMKHARMMHLQVSITHLQTTEAIHADVLQTLEAIHADDLLQEIDHSKTITIIEEMIDTITTETIHNVTDHFLAVHLGRIQDTTTIMILKVSFCRISKITLMQYLPMT